MLGSILSNLLLVMGMCFLLGGLLHRGESGNGTEQSFSSATAQTTCSMMTLASASLIIPAAVGFLTPHIHIMKSWTDFPFSCMLSLTRAAPRTR